jgi:type IV pilus assembly protein PilW
MPGSDPPQPLSLPTAGRRAARGFTLVELLVACAVAMLVLGSVAMMFGGTSSGRLEVERAGRLTGNAAFAVELLSDDIRVAGYFAETGRAGVAWQAPDPCNTAIDAIGFSVSPFTLPVPIAGYRGGDATPSCLEHRKDGTAAVVLRRFDVVSTPPEAATGAPFWQVSSCAADVTRTVYASAPSAFTMRKLDCTALADAHRVVVRSYYVSTCNECGVDTIPTLKRAELAGDAIVVTPLVEGVENFQVEYGFDTDGDGNADVYRDHLSGVAGAPDNEWWNVVSVRLYVLGRSTDSSPGYVDTAKRFYMGPAGYTTVSNDPYKRVQLSSMVRLHNVAGLRERP